MGKANANDLDWETVDRGEAGWRRKRLARAADGDDLGCSLYELPPGKRSWPYHYHSANDEALYVLDGRGSLRLAGETLEIEAGDYVPFPADERGAHQLLNETDAPLRYLMLSTMVEPDVTVYPDSGKIGAMAGAPPGGAADKRLGGFFRLDDAVDYWEGEE